MHFKKLKVPKKIKRRLKKSIKKHQVLIGATLITLLILSLIGNITVSWVLRQRVREPKVLAFYYPWYSDNAWASVDTPVLGRYLSQDSDIIRQHLIWAQQAHIDVLIASWWGKNDYTDKAIEKLLVLAEKTPVQIAIYYEKTPDDAGRPQDAINDFSYLLEKYGRSPAFFKIDNKPVIFIYSRAVDQLWGQWENIIPTIRERYEICLITDIVIDATSWYKQVAPFDGLHHYNIIELLDMYSHHFLFMPSVSAIFKMQVLTTKISGKISTVTVNPGYDDSSIAERTHHVTVGRRDGILYRLLWQEAIAANPDWIIITSFNEWYERSEIEPSQEFGDLYLKITARYAAQFKTGLP